MLERYSYRTQIRIRKTQRILQFVFLVIGFVTLFTFGRLVDFRIWSLCFGALCLFAGLGLEVQMVNDRLCRCELFCRHIGSLMVGVAWQERSEASAARIAKEVATFFPLIADPEEAEWFFQNSLSLCLKELGAEDPGYIELVEVHARFRSALQPTFPSSRREKDATTNGQA
jgi:hypothetical protein